MFDGVTRTLTHEYDDHGNRTLVTHPDGPAFRYVYDGLDRLTTLYEGTGTSVVLAGFSYNASGLPSGATRGGTTSAYGYDSVGRLASLGHDLASTSADQTLTFTHNPANQIATRTSANDTYRSNTAYAVSRNYAVNGLNQYTSAGAATFAYDLNGNLTSDGSTTFLYDAENRLVSATGGRNASLRYDPLGRLYEVTGGGTTTRFLYDGDALVGEYVAGLVNARYVHGSNAGADDPLIWYPGSGLTQRQSLLADHQGSIIAATEASGGAAVIYAYDAWGIPNSSNNGRFQYTGQAWLNELGMYYYKARIYSPTLGRFLQIDPVGYQGGNNLYAYVNNDPVNLNDPDGQFPLAIPIIIGARCALSAPCRETVRAGVIVAAGLLMTSPPEVPGSDPRVSSQHNGGPPLNDGDPEETRTPVVAPTGRARNHLRPDERATGPHSTFRRNRQTGDVEHTATYSPNPRNPRGFDEVQRMDVTGRGHVNRVTRQEVPTPHVQGRDIPGGVREAIPREIPRRCPRKPSCVP
jgi:RHS repeat-associated protein